MRVYEAPELFVDEYVADTMIASSNTKSGNPDNNQNCWGCDTYPGQTVGNNSCGAYIPSSAYPPGILTPEESASMDALYNANCR